jgi:hypothetical protein
METKNLKKVIRRKHRWDLALNFDQMSEITWETLFVTVSFALAITSGIGLVKATSVSGFLVSYIGIVVMLVAFSINFVHLFRHLVLMVCAAWHVAKQNVEEQKDIDFGTTTTYYNPDTQTEMSEEDYIDLVRKEVAKEMEDQEKKNGQARIEAEMARKEFDRKACTVPHGDELTADPKTEEKGAN